MRRKTDLFAAEWNFYNTRSAKTSRSINQDFLKLILLQLSSPGNYKRDIKSRRTCSIYKNIDKFLRAFKRNIFVLRPLAPDTSGGFHIPAQPEQ